MLRMLSDYLSWYEQTHSADRVVSFFCSVVFVGVAGTVVFSNPLRSATSLSGVSDGAVLSIDIEGEYSEKPGQGYWFVDPTRFVEPQRTSTIKLVGQSSTGAALSTCSYATEHVQGASAESGPWDSITEVEAASEFSRSGVTDTASFTVRYPSPAQYKLAVSCEFEDGEKAKLETVRAFCTFFSFSGLCFL